MRTTQARARARRAGTDLVGVVGAVVAALVVAMLAHRTRPSRLGTVPQRVVAGDDVVTPDGMFGTAVQTDGPAALVAVDQHQLWVQARTLMRPERPCPSSSPSEQPLETDPRMTAHRPSVLLLAHGWFARLGLRIHQHRRAVVGAWIVGLLCCVPLSATVSHVLQPGGFVVKGGDTEIVANQLASQFGQPRSSIVALVPGRLTDPAVRAQIARLDAALRKVPHVSAVNPPQPSPTGAYAAIGIDFDVIDQIAVPDVPLVRAAFAHAGYSKAQAQLAGTAVTAADTNEQARTDLAQAERWGVPAAMLVLVLVFGTLTAALLPIVVGVTSLIVSLALLHLIGTQMSLSVFVMNIASMLGLGLGIDYSLLGVSRFREELDRGASVSEAIQTTMASAGRAAVISGLAVLCGFGALLIIPLGVMTSIAIGGMVVVAVTVVASLTLLPAMLALLGPRVERFAIFKRHRTEPTASRWYRAAKGVMRMPLLSLLVGVGLLLTLIIPFSRAHFELPHDEVLPKASPSMVAQRVLSYRLHTLVRAPITVIVQTTDPATLTALETRMSQLRHVREVQQIGASKDGHATAIQIIPDDATRIGGAQARALVGQVRALPGPHHRVGGVAEGEREFLGAVAHDLPIVALLVMCSTLLILGIGFRSLTLPLKAIMLDSLSILASFGAITLVFQDGFGISLLHTAPLGYTDGSLPIILLCILFGLSMDYEVFMLARITELHQSGLSEEEAVAQGVASTAPLVTGAASILIVIGVAFAFTKLVLVQEIGFGMAAALAIDATVVRLLLLPATMRFLGAANWWLPKPLLRRIPRTDWAH